MAIITDKNRHAGWDDLHATKTLNGLKSTPTLPLMSLTNRPLSQYV